MNRPSEADPLFRRALAIEEKNHGADDPNVARVLNNLAGLLNATNRPSEAEPFFRRALLINEKTYGADHPEVATVLSNLARLLSATNRPSEAEPLFQRALTILMHFRRATGHQHPFFERIHARYVQMLTSLGQNEAEIGKFQ